MADETRTVRLLEPIGVAPKGAAPNEIGTRTVSLFELIGVAAMGAEPNDIDQLRARMMGCVMRSARRTGAEI
jgi:hypothetical protein